MRTTVDLPDALFRKTKAVAALRGTSMKEIIVKALEEEVNRSPKQGRRKIPANFPFIHLKSGRKLDLSNFDFDELLG